MCSISDVVLCVGLVDACVGTESTFDTVPIRLCRDFVWLICGGDSDEARARCKGRAVNK